MANGKYKDLNNQEYWIKRSENIAEKPYKDIKKNEKKLAKVYRNATVDFHENLATIYANYATDNNLAYVDAIKDLSKIETLNYETSMKEAYKKAVSIGDERLIAEINRVRAQSNVSRLQSLINQMDVKLAEMGYAEQMTIEDTLYDQFQESYYRNMHIIQTGTQLGFSFSLLNDRAIREAINMPWSGDMFSDNIWDNKRKLLKNLRSTITEGLVKGESYQKMSRNLSQKMDSGYKDSLRIIRTETAHVVNEATARSYKESGIVAQYIIIATLDIKTSKICQGQDLNVYDLDKKVVGENFPPFHPHCRSAVSPYFGDGQDLDGTRIARDAEGNNIKIPRNMSYLEWKKMYIK